MRSRSMQSLTDAIKRRFPGVVIGGIGDAAHKLRTSDHNEDDTPGSRAAQSDADSNPEHRAIDVMLGPALTQAQAYALIADLLGDPAALRRLKYIIFDGWIWSRTNGWKRAEFTGDDKHRDHPHISGDAADDENAAGWPAAEGDDMTPEQDKKLNAVYMGLFGGGPSCGDPVDPENVVNDKPGSDGKRSAVAQAAFDFKNGHFSQLKQIRANQAKILAALTDADSGMTPEQLAALGVDVADRLGALRFVPDTDS